MTEPGSVTGSQARLRWRCRRGLLELDLILGDVMDTRYSLLTPAEQAVFLQLLEFPDNELLDYFHGRRQPEQIELKELIRKIS